MPTDSWRNSAFPCRPHLLTSLSKADRLAASIAEALKEAGLSEGRSVKPSDMLRFGMGLGITLGANGLLNELEGESGGGGAQGEDRRGRARRADADGGKEVAAGRETSLAPPVVKVGARCNFACGWCLLLVRRDNLLCYNSLLCYSSLLSQWLEGIPY